MYLSQLFDGTANWGTVGRHTLQLSLSFLQEALCDVTKGTEVPDQMLAADVSTTWFMRPSPNTWRDHQRVASRRKHFGRGAEG